LAEAKFSTARHPTNPREAIEQIIGRKNIPLSEAIVKGIYTILRNLKGFDDEKVLNMPSPRFWVLLEMLQEEAEMRERESRKQRRGKGKW